MAKSALASSGIAANANFGTTYYVILGMSGITFETTEALTQITYRTAGTLSDIYAKVTGNSLSGGTGSSVIKIRINGADGTQSITIANAATGEFTDATPSNTDSVSVGDEVNYSFVTGGTSGAIAVRHFVTNFDPGSGVFVQYGVASPSPLSDGQTAYLGLSSQATNIATIESRAQAELNSGNVTFRNLFAYVSTNTINVDSSLDFRDDAASTISCVLTASTTGIFEETATGVTPATNSLVNFRAIATGVAGSFALTIEIASIGATSSDTKYLSPTDDSNGTVTNTVVNYANVNGKGSTDSDKTLRQRSARIASDMSNMVVQISANTANGTSTVAIMVGGTDSVVSASIGATLTGFFEDTDSVTVASTDLINYSITRGGTGDLTSRSMCCMITLPASVVTPVFIGTRFFTLMGVGT